MTSPAITRNDLWCTPSEVTGSFETRVGKIGLDPCASNNKDRHFAQVNLTRGQDGLSEPWDTEDFIFVNPPYGRGHMPLWADRIAEYADRRKILLLGPARVECTWFHRLAPRCRVLGFPRGRFRFVDEETGEPAGNGRMGSAFLYLEPPDAKAWMLVASWLDSLQCVTLTNAGQQLSYQR